MIYRILRKIVQTSLLVFFKKISVSDRDVMPTEGPVIVVANHPNTLMDPLLLAVMIRQRIGFLANGGIFINPLVNSILRFFHVIPIYRQQDRKPGQEADHSQSFLECHNYLDKNASLLIFPEGTSVYELNLRPIKTGTARIALSMEHEHQFERGLLIAPVALNYSDAIQFRSAVHLRFLEPIKVSDYKEDFLENEETAIKLLTDNIRKKLAAYVTQTDDKAQENFLILLHRFYLAYQDPKSKWHKDPKRSSEIRLYIADRLQKVRKTDPKSYETIQNDVTKYFQLIKTYKLSPGFLKPGYSRSDAWLHFIGQLVLIMFLSPLYFFGLLANYIPYKLPEFIYKKLNIDIEYKAPVQMIIGLICFPIYYYLLIWLFSTHVSTNWKYILIFFISLPISGYISMYTWMLLKRLKRNYNFLFKLSKSSWETLKRLRNQLIETLQMY